MLLKIIYFALAVSVAIVASGILVKQYCETQFVILQSYSTEVERGRLETVRNFSPPLTLDPKFAEYLEVWDESIGIVERPVLDEYKKRCEESLLKIGCNSFKCIQIRQSCVVQLDSDSHPKLSSSCKLEPALDANVVKQSLYH